MASWWRHDYIAAPVARLLFTSFLFRISSLFFTMLSLLLLRAYIALLSLLVTGSIVNTLQLTRLHTHTHTRARVHTYTLTHLEVRMQLMASSHCSHQTIQSVAKWNHWIDRRISFISIRLLTCKPTRKSTIKLAPKWAWNTTDWLTSRLGSWIGSWLQNRLKSWR